MLEITKLSAEEITMALPRWRAMLLGAVESGGWAGFLLPVSGAAADGYWARVAEEVASGGRVLLAAAEDGLLAGAVQVHFPAQPYTLHRAEPGRLFVFPEFRGRGIARSLMQAVERECRAAGKRLMFGDTRAGAGVEQLYFSLGWKAAGIVPRFVISSSGELEDVRFLFKELD